MKKLLMGFMLAVTGGSVALAQTNFYRFDSSGNSNGLSLKEAKAFLADENKGVLEDSTPPAQTAQDLAFLRYVAENWRQALTLLDTDAPDPRRQRLIIAAAEVLPARDYVSFLNGVCALSESGKIKIIGQDFCYGYFIKESFLEYNYDNPMVAALIDRMEAICKNQDPEEWGEYFAEIKSGKRKEELVKTLTAYGDPMPETYAANSKEVYNALVKGHKALLAEEAKGIKRKSDAETDDAAAISDRRSIIRIVEIGPDGEEWVIMKELQDEPAEDSEAQGENDAETNRLSAVTTGKKPDRDNITVKDERPQGEQPQDETAESERMPWKLLLLIVGLAVAGVVAVWHRVKRR